MFLFFMIKSVWELCYFDSDESGRTQLLEDDATNVCLLMVFKLVLNSINELYFDKFVTK